MAAWGVSAGGERPRFHRPRCCRIGEIDRGFGTKFLDLFQTQINNLDPAPDQPPTTGDREVCHPRGHVHRFECCSAHLGATYDALGRTGARNEVRSDVQRRFGEGRDPVFFPLVPAVLTCLVSCVVETDHAGPCGRGDIMAGIHPCVHIIVTEELDRVTYIQGQQSRRPDEINYSQPGVTSIRQRP